MIINDNNRIMLGGGALPRLHPPCWPAVRRRENIGSGGAPAPSHRPPFASAFGLVRRSSASASGLY